MRKFPRQARLSLRHREEFRGRLVNGLKTADLLKLRRKIGMIFQGFNLLQQKTVLKNVAFPLEVAGVKRKDAAKKAEELLKEMGLGDKLPFRFPAKLNPS